MERSHVGFIGVGRMGHPMVVRLLAAGHRVSVFDNNPKAMDAATAAGAIAAESIAALSNSVELVLSSLPTPEILHEVMLGEGGVAGGSRVKTVIDLSTSGRRMAAKLAGALAKKKIAWVDAPVSGGLSGAINGTLAVMLSCRQDVRPAVESVLSNFGPVFYVGEAAGLGQVAKLGNNILSAGAMVMTAEVMAMGVKAGLSPTVLLDIINAGSGRNTATQDKFPRQVLTGKFAHGFALGLAYKDVRLCVDEAEAIGVPMIAGGITRQMMAVATARYGEEADFTDVARLLEEWANVEIRG